MVGGLKAVAVGRRRWLAVAVDGLPAVAEVFLAFLQMFADTSLRDCPVVLLKVHQDLSPENGSIISCTMHQILLILFSFYNFFSLSLSLSVFNIFISSVVNTSQ